MLQISPQPLAVSGAGYFLLAHLDGERTVEELRGAFRRETGQEVPLDEVEKLVAALDHYAMLETPRFAEAFAAQREAYGAAETHDCRHRWPEADALRAEIEHMLHDAAPGVGGQPRGIITPHLDYARGAPCYAAAYAMLAGAPPAERYVILGTNHFGLSASCGREQQGLRNGVGTGID